MAPATLGRAMRERWLERARKSIEERESWWPEWRDATGDMQYVMYVTPDELRALYEDVVTLLTRYHDRTQDPSLRPEGSRAIDALAMFYAVERAQLDG
jgi:hypothetical protein